MPRSAAWRRSLPLILAAALAVGTGRAAATSTGPAGPRIAVVAIVDHPSVDAMRRGIGDALRAAPLPAGAPVGIGYETASADPARADAIVRRLLDGDASLVIALSEPMARAVAAQPLRIPVVVAGIPLAAADAISANRQAKLLTGVAIGNAHRVQMALVATLRPDARSVLVPWSGAVGEPPAMVRSLVAAARTQAFSVTAWRVPATATGAALLPDLPEAAKTVVYLAGDAAGARADALIDEAARRGLPVVADRRALVVRGATATIVHDWYAIGREAGDIAAGILRDPTQARRPIHRAEARFVVVNGEALRDRRLHLAPAIDGIADEVIEWAQLNGPNPLAKPEPPAHRGTVP